MDYRDLQGRFDKIVSIEMFEAVGQAYWPTYFAKIARMLKSGGRAVIQSITIDHGSFQSYRDQPDFIQRYTFLADVAFSAYAGNTSGAGRFGVVAEHGYAPHYAARFKNGLVFWLRGHWPVINLTTDLS